MPRLILDAMGGDRAPRANLEGALAALPELDETGGELILVGDEQVLKSEMNRRRLRPLLEAIKRSEGTASSTPSKQTNFCRVRIVHASESIGMDDSIRSVRSKPHASINVGCRMAAEDWEMWKRDPSHEPSAFISAGHSGAMMASALMHMGRLKGVERPAIAVKIPTLSPDGCIMLDVGANVDCRPEHLRDFAVMGALFAQAERQSTHLPRVALLSNGEERSKGNELTRAALEMIEKLPCFVDPEQKVGRFIGYSEGKELFKGHVEVVITDGFVGNLVLKAIEGLGSAVVTLLKREAVRNPLNSAGFLLSAGAFRGLKKKLDYAEYGAAPLLGVAGYAFICHGRSNGKAIKNALLRTRTALQSRFVERLELALESSSGAS